MNYDITFCSNKNCKQECKRNQSKIQQENKLLYIEISNFEDCEHFKNLLTEE